MTATKLDLVKVEDWGLFTDTTKPIIIAGPCSAESEQQVFETAKGLKAAGSFEGRDLETPYPSELFRGSRFRRISLDEAGAA